MHNCLWLNVWYSFSSYFLIFFPIFPKYRTIFPKYLIFPSFVKYLLFLKNPGRFFQIIHLFFKTPGDFPFFRFSGLRIFSFLFYPACNFQNSCIFSKSLISNLPIFQSNGIQSAWFCFFWGSHLLRGATKSSRSSSSQHRTLLPPVVLCLVQKLLSYVSGPFERLRVGTGICSRKSWQLMAIWSMHWQSDGIRALAHSGSRGARWHYWWMSFQGLWDCLSQPVNLEIC